MEHAMLRHTSASMQVSFSIRIVLYLCRFTKNGKVHPRTVCHIDLDPACMEKLVWKSIRENEHAPDDSQAMASGSSAAATPVPASEPSAPALWLGLTPALARHQGRNAETFGIPLISPLMRERV